MRGVIAAKPVNAGRTTAHKRTNHARPGSHAGPSQRASSTPPGNNVTPPVPISGVIARQASRNPSSTCGPTTHIVPTTG